LKKSRIICAVSEILLLFLLFCGCSDLSEKDTVGKAEEETTAPLYAAEQDEIINKEKSSAEDGEPVPTETEPESELESAALEPEETEPETPTSQEEPEPASEKEEIASELEGESQEKASQQEETASENETSQTLSESGEIGGTLCWIPTKGGKKYHSKESCSNMSDPARVTVEEAELRGFTPCKKCH